MNRHPINVNNDDLHHVTLEAHQKIDKGKDIQKDPPIYIAGATVAVQQEMEDHGHMVWSLCARAHSPAHN